MASIPPLPGEPPLIGPVLIPETAVPRSAGVMALMSSNRRDGEWLLPRLFRAVAFMGELHLDLTRVRLGAGVSEIELVAIMGQVNVRVPQNLRLEVHGQPVMGELQVNWGATGTASADAPLLRIHAGGFMGALVVDVVDPNAAGWLDRWRTKRRSR